MNAISRRRLFKGLAGAAALGSASKTLAAPARIQSTGSDTEINYWSTFWKWRGW